MRRRLLPLACLLAGGFLGYLLVAARPAPAGSPGAPGEASDGEALRGERDQLLARRDEIRTRLADRARRAEWAARLREPVRTVSETDDPEKGSVRLLVRDPEGNPLAGRRLLAFDLGKYNQDVKTDEEGAVRLDGVPPRRLHVTLYTGGGMRSLDVDVTAGRLTEVLVPAPRGRATVTGVLRDRTEGPLSGVSINLRMKLGIYRDSLTTKTDEEGRYAFEAVPAGPWTAHAFGGPLEKNRYVTAEVAVPEEGNCVADLVAGVPSLSGIVTVEESGEALAGVTIRLSSDRYRMQDRPTGEDGRYRFLDLPPGRWNVQTILEGYVRWNSKRFVLEEGETKTLDIAVARAAEVVAVVLDADGRPVSGQVGVSFRVPGERWARYVQVGLASEKGEIRYRELPAGEYEVRATVHGTDARGTTVHTFEAGVVNRVEIRTSR